MNNFWRGLAFVKEILMISCATAKITSDFCIEKDAKV